MRRRAVGAVLCAMLALVVLPAAATAGEPAGVEHLHYAAGPYHITPGANLILFDYRHVPKPNADGFMLRMQPNARYALPNGKWCGKVPLTNIIHLHHGVWLTNGPAGVSTTSWQRVDSQALLSGRQRRRARWTVWATFTAPAQCF